MLAVCWVAQFMVMLGLSIVSVSLPSIQSSLDFTSAGLQWVVDAYAIVFAGSLLLGCRAASRFGQRRVLVVGLCAFSITSLIGGSAGTRELLIIARAVQGFSAAFIASSSLAIITSSLPPGRQLRRAIGRWAAMNGAGLAAGVVLGGIIAETLSWRWALMIDLPVGIVTAIVGWAVVPDYRRPRRWRAYDLAGGATLTVALMVLSYGAVYADLRGWHATRTVELVLGGLTLLGLFYVIETKVAAGALVPFNVIDKPLRAAGMIVVTFSAAVFPVWYFSSLSLQQAFGLSPIRAGLTLLPIALTLVLLARVAAKLLKRFGTRAVLGSGLAMLAAGYCCSAGSPHTAVRSSRPQFQAFSRLPGSGYRASPQRVRSSAASAEDRRALRPDS